MEESCELGGEKTLRLDNYNLVQFPIWTYI